MLSDLLEPEDQAFAIAFSVDRWAKSGDFRKVHKNRLFTTLDVLSKRLTIHGADPSVATRPLVDMLALVLQHDPAFRGWWLATKAQDLQKAETWPRLYRCAAAYVVERWLRDKKPESDTADLWLSTIRPPRQLLSDS